MDVRAGAGRFEGGSPGVRTRHAFSFGAHYDPENVGFGLLSACNEETLDPGAGFAEHPHRDTEIVTWVIEGELEHRDATGAATRLAAGDLQGLSAAGGVRHSERNAGPGPLRFLQMWLRPDAYGGAPRYTAVTDPAPPGEGLRLLASGRPGDAAPVELRQRAAALHAGRTAGTGAWALPDAAHLYVHVVRGAVTLTAPDPAGSPGTAALGPGDAARITGAHGVRAAAAGPAEFLVWEMHAARP
ncbi:pirin family protein [Streptomyces sp. V4-01]|uniref:Pirin family protein n=1 Tax=Actinacidiphila polyblastidii TaxID=3110430 RepID=A0ABU7PES9_9ACTN|nr:pirin family protein [Streptomyces sp. V4-01]